MKNTKSIGFSLFSKWATQAFIRWDLLWLGKLGAWSAWERTELLVFGVFGVLFFMIPWKKIGENM